MEFKIYNTMSRQLDVFNAIQPGQVGVYTCGPTVYHHAHIGNLRAYVFSDVLVRTLTLLGMTVRHVMNITDVGHLTSDADEGDDKMEVGAAREGITAWDIAQRYTQSFFEQCAALNIRQPTIVCRATDHIPQQIAMIRQLEARGFTYATDDGIYFDTAKMPSYGALARLDIEGLRAGARVEVGSKRNKTDFALWKLCAPGESRQMEWDSPWGRGFPGWHIECSAMSTHYLGNRFDIHTGGIDHIPIHHTNEIAQSESATGCRPFVNYWMHNNFLQMGEADEKMAKSKGGFTTVFTLREMGYDPLAFRLLCLKAHYRSPMRFSFDALDGAAVQYRRLRSDLQLLAAETRASSARGCGDDELRRSYETEIKQAVANDLATPVALTTMQRALADSRLSAQGKRELVGIADAVLGLDLLAGPEAAIDTGGEELRLLVEERAAARGRRDWASSDELRRRIEHLGYVVEDTASGPKIKRMTT
jgi:cysteinyl-tRNA synthetase